MARSTSLSDEAFAALREEKREGESDSDVVLRLRREARTKRKNALRFLEWKADFVWTDEEWAEIQRKMAEADRIHALVE